MKNDELILQLKNKVAEKKKLIDKTQRFSPLTNLSLTFFGQNYNLNTLGKDELLLLAATLKSIQSQIDVDIKVSGFNFNDWIQDLQAKYDILNVKEEERRLKALETQLDNLLSNDKKVELQLEDLMKQIG